jgi:putative toxin-antitoxin system antitoxin component (TIGR02293 family)
VKERQIASMLGGVQVLGHEVTSLQELSKLVCEGLPYQAFEHIVQTFDLGIERVSEIVNLSKSTRLRRQDAGRLNPEESDRLCRFARILTHAMDVFDDESHVVEWLWNPNTALGQQPPVQLLATDVGTDQVDRLLTRIEHGIVS